MSKFGWSLPAGCGTLSGEEPEEWESVRYCTCGHEDSRHDTKTAACKVLNCKCQMFVDAPAFDICPNCGGKMEVGEDYSFCHDCGRRTGLTYQEGVPDTGLYLD